LDEDEEDPDSEEEGDDSDSDEERTRARMSFENCNVMLRVFLIRFPVVIAMRNNISALINQKEESLIMPTSVSIPAATSKAVKKEIKPLPKKGVAIKKTQIPVLSFEQKKDLCQAIQTLDGQKLQRVTQIIHEGVPEIRDVRSILPQAILFP
jgi:bromodomain-containing factor 1